MWILSALLVIATLDARPDPPAVDPHAVKAKATSLLGYSGEDGVQHLSCESLKVAPCLPSHSSGWADTGEPEGTTGALALVRHAADSSPPAPSPTFRSQATDYPNQSSGPR